MSEHILNREREYKEYAALKAIDIQAMVQNIEIRNSLEPIQWGYMAVPHSLYHAMPEEEMSCGA